MSIKEPSYTDSDEPLPDIPLGVPTAARMYDEALGGKDHFAVDREANARLYEVIGEQVVRSTALENRRFLGRAVRYLAQECGIRQFLDIGSGLPTESNTHQIAEAVDPGVKVVYVDIDPIVAMHGRALLATDNTRIVTADMRAPDTILNDPKTQEILDFSRPIAVLFVAVFHMVSHQEDPARIIAAVRERQAPGSYIALSHLTNDGVAPENVAAWEAAFEGAPTSITLRTEPEIRDLFDGYELVEPGLVRPHDWRPNVEGSPRTSLLLGGVGRLAAG